MKTIIKKIILFLYTFMLSSICFSNAKVGEKLPLIANLKKINFFYADFIQVIYHEKKIIQQTTGTLKFLKPNFFYWDTKNPSQIINADGQKIYIYDKDLEQVTIKPQSFELEQTPAMFLLSDPDRIKKYYHIKECFQNSNCYTLKAIKKDSNYQEIEITFFKQKMKKIAIIDPLGQKTSITFTKLYSQLLSKKNFVFNIPKNIDIIQ